MAPRIVGKVANFHVDIAKYIFTRKCIHRTAPRGEIGRAGKRRQGVRVEKREDSRWGINIPKMK